MSIPVGTTIEEGTVVDPWYITRPTDGTSGASSSGTTSIDGSAAQKALEADELAGKIGAIITPYDPEGANRLIQEF